ncbi:MAG: ATP-binding protein [Deltaproteobacteria bacterium]|nr:ATP-binding protein [Deltaproteobacteria bacterium]
MDYGPRTTDHGLLRLKFGVRSDFKYLPFLTRLFGSLRFPNAFALTQILVEAFDNAVVHGNNRNKAKWITIDVLSSKSRTKLRVADDGPGIRKKYFSRRPKLRQAGGRGLTLIQAYANRVSSRKDKGRHYLSITLRNKVLGPWSVVRGPKNE